MSFIYLILCIFVITLIHEFGHFIVAKLCNVYVIEFSIGYGPLLFDIETEETVFSFRAIPLGGYVRLAGEENLDSDPDVPNERKLNSIKPIHKFALFLAGIFNNLVFGVIIYSVINLMLGYYLVYPKPIINEVSENMPAYNAGLQKDDYIYSMTFEDGLCIKPRTFNDVANYISSFDGEIEFVIIRNNEKLTYNITPIESEDRKIIGVTMYDIDARKVTPLNCLYYGFLSAKDMVLNVYDSLVNMLRLRGMKNMSGLIGVYEVTDELVSSSQSSFEVVYYILSILALLTINIGIFNLLPIPLLDGGKCVMCLYELITNKPINKKVEQYLLYGSLILIFSLLIFVTFNDISKIIL